MAEKKEDLYVGLKEPAEIRRMLLEGSRTVLRLLQRYERFKSLRDEKVELLERLKKLTHELSDLDVRLKSLLPKQAVRKVMKKKAVPKKEEKGDAPEPEEKPEKHAEINKLESSLSDIEDKLKSLS